MTLQDAIGLLPYIVLFLSGIVCVICQALMRNFLVDKGILTKEFPGEYYLKGATIELYYKYGKSVGKMGIYLKIWIISACVFITSILSTWIVNKI